MATLENRSPRRVQWGTLNVGDSSGVAPAARGDLAPGATAHFSHPNSSAYWLQVRASGWWPTASVLARPSETLTSTDSLVFDGMTVTRATTPPPVLRDTGFRPSQRGFLFGNSFPRNTPHFTLQIDGQTRGVFDAGMGLCGGMVYAALDYFATLTRPGNTHTPATGMLFEYLCRRLVDSFGGATGVTRYLHLMHPSCTPAERARTMIVDEWPRIRASIDGNLPAPMALVLVTSDSPFELGNNHQVLAYAYELSAASVILHVYDPNQPTRDDVRLHLDLAAVNGTTAELSGTGTSVLSFFRTDYSLQTPPPVRQVPVTSLPQRADLTRGGRGWVEGNGHIGMFEFDPADSNGNFNGSLYGNAISGRWMYGQNGQDDRLEFVRTIAGEYNQVWTGRRRADGSLVGSFHERDGILSRRQRYSWRAHSSLIVDGNGWTGELRLSNWFGNGDFHGTIYGQPMHGHWDAASQTLNFTRDLGSGKHQEWSGSRTFGLDFQGHFQEVSGGNPQPQQYRWVARLASQLDDRISVHNRLGSPEAVLFFAPEGPAPNLPMQALVLGIDEIRHVTIPLGLPLLLTRLRADFNHGGEILAGYGDAIMIAANGDVSLV